MSQLTKNPCGEIYIDQQPYKAVDLLDTVVGKDNWYKVIMTYEAYWWVKNNYVEEIDYRDKPELYQFCLWVKESVYLMLRLKWA